MRTWGLFLILALCGCPQPLPPAPPGPPGDVFAGVILDCSLPVVASQRPQAETPVANCLVGGAAQVCLSGLATMFAPDTVGCVARDLGAAANVRVLGGQAAGHDDVVDAITRAWITREHLGFK